jgi:hypothetical protein
MLSYPSTQKVEVTFSFETLVTIYQSTRRYLPEDSYLPSHCRESLKFNNAI